MVSLMENNMYGLIRICRQSGEKVLIIASDVDSSKALTDFEDVTAQKAEMEGSWGEEYTFEIIQYVG
ncbi:MAG: hypothetical protein ACXW1D_00090 [Halobacteriota archaeon]